MCQNRQVARPWVLLTLELKSQIREAIKSTEAQGIQKERYWPETDKGKIRQVRIHLMQRLQTWDPEVRASEEKRAISRTNISVISWINEASFLRGLFLSSPEWLQHHSWSLWYPNGEREGACTVVVHVDLASWLLPHSSAEFCLSLFRWEHFLGLYRLPSCWFSWSVSRRHYLWVCYSAKSGWNGTFA